MSYESKLISEVLNSGRKTAAGQKQDRTAVWSAIWSQSRWFFMRPLKTWALFFTLLLLFTFQPGGPNSSSRLFAIMNIVETGHPNIDAYHKQTIDWAQTPDGHYYSNKAPGPILLAVPFYYVLDRVLTSGYSTRAERDDQRARMLDPVDRLISYFFQTLPLLLLFAAWTQQLRKENTRKVALHWMILCGVLGNTLTLMTSTYYGHAMAGAFLLGMGLAIWRGNLFWSFFLWGFAVLTEYTSAVVGLPLVIAFWPQIRHQPNKSVRNLILAGIAPGILWVVYHQVCFGGILQLPNKFQNPLFVDRAKLSLWGVFGLPNPWAVVQLLIGPARGLLWTQPWMLTLLFMPAFTKQWPAMRTWTATPRARLTFVTMVSFALFLVVNASFGNWEAGAVAGARYLSPLFPLMAVLVAAFWKDMPQVQRNSIRVGGTLAALFHVTWLSLQDFPGMKPLWYEVFIRFRMQAYQSEALTAVAACGVFLFLLSSANFTRSSSDSDGPSNLMA